MTSTLDNRRALMTFSLPKWARPVTSLKHNRQRRLERYIIAVLGVYCLFRLLNWAVSSPTPQIQYAFDDRSYVQLQRQQAVKKEFRHAWDGYRDHSWMADGLLPLSGGGKTQFCSWSATLVDALDTLWIMGLTEEFNDAVNATMTINFRSNAGMCEVSLFESTIRYLGGLLGAYDLSHEPRLLTKMVEVGDILHSAFKTNNGMPCSFCHLASMDEVFMPSSNVAMADVGSLYLEFARLSQLTGDPKYQQTVDHVLNAFDRTANDSTIPGLWPEMVDSSSITPQHDGDPPHFAKASYTYSLGALSDSSYEYLVKGHMLLGAVNSTYARLWETASEQMRNFMLFRAFIPDADEADRDVLFSGVVTRTEGSPEVELEPRTQHLACFAGGMFGMASKIFDMPEDFEIGRQLTQGCVWAYDHSPTGLMPESLSLAACPGLDQTQCSWNESAWENYRQTCALDGSCREQSLPPGWVAVGRPEYILRPEAIESVFIMWRMTGDEYWRDVGWRMFQSIIHHTRTPFGHSAIESVLYQAETQIYQHGVPMTTMRALQRNDMESFWFAETLKYFYLLFSDVDLIDLDEYVLNTEAHPLRLTEGLRGF